MDTEMPGHGMEIKRTQALVRRARSVEDRIKDLAELRRKHGFRPPVEARPRVGDWSRRVLAGEDEIKVDDGNGEGRWVSLKDLVAGFGVTQQDVNDRARAENWPFVPRNALVLEAARRRLDCLGFGWEPVEKVVRNGTTRHFVRFTNFPTVGGLQIALVELLLIPFEVLDGAERVVAIRHLVERQGQPANFGPKRNRMERVGVGYKGLSGVGDRGMVSWLPGIEPFHLPSSFERQLQDLAEATFLLNDAVGALYGNDPEVTALLTHKVPDRIRRIVSPGRVDIVRPDIVIVRDPDGTLRPVVTEFESAPGGHGMTHAMQVGYGLPYTMLDTFVRYLDGRRYVVLATNEWPEYVFEQGAFCAALRKRGVDARILFDAPLTDIHTRVQKNWKLPPGALDWVGKAWTNDFLGRLRELGFLEFVGGCAPADLPTQWNNPEGLVVFRFGYVDNWSAPALDRLEEWARDGVTIINPTWFFLENKALMAAALLPAVRQWMCERSDTALKALDRHVAKTWVLDPRFVSLTDVRGDDERNQACRQLLLSKFGAWDGHNQSWGSRSVEVGARMSGAAWGELIDARCALPHPVVVQHLIHSATYHVGYEGRDGNVAVLYDARTRLTPFFLRDRAGKAMHAGSTLTLRAGTYRIHGATDAVEAPVIFTD